MTLENQNWKRQSRKIIYDTQYLKLYSDTVKLPDGKLVEDYSVVELPDGVVIVATDDKDRLIAFDEYKYAVDHVIFALPAGGIDKGESVIEAAKRELLEETGYTSDDIEYIDALHVYPSKIIHLNHVVRVRNARLFETPRFEGIETIGQVRLIELNDLVTMKREGKLNATYILAPLAITLPEYL